MRVRNGFGVRISNSAESQDTTEKMVVPAGTAPVVTGGAHFGHKSAELKVYNSIQPLFRSDHKTDDNRGKSEGYSDETRTKVAALYVIKNGPYFGLPDVDPWDESRDARKYSGPHPVVAHPPCERWGRYWSGGPSAKVKRILGDDHGCFASALGAVVTFNGLLEHPEGSHAFRAFNLPIPSWWDGWTEPDKFGGRSICVAQGHYGHAARKMTWLYGVGIDFRELVRGPSQGGLRLDEGFHSKEERRRAIRTGVGKRLSARQRKLTPEPFRDLLIELARTAA